MASELKYIEAPPKNFLECNAIVNSTHCKKLQQHSFYHKKHHCEIIQKRYVTLYAPAYIMRSDYHYNFLNHVIGNSNS